MHTDVEGLKESLRRLVGSEIKKIAALQLFLQRILPAKTVNLDNVQSTRLLYVSKYSGQIFMKEDSDTLINQSLQKTHHSIRDILSLGLVFHLKTRHDSSTKKLEPGNIISKLQEKLARTMFRLTMMKIFSVN